MKIISNPVLGSVQLFISYGVCKIVEIDISEARKLVSHLEQKGEYQTLYELGFYNKNGMKETRRVIGMLSILYDKYIETKDDAYLLYAEFAEKAAIKDCVLIFSITIIIGVLLSVF